MCWYCKKIGDVKAAPQSPQEIATKKPGSILQPLPLVCPSIGLPFQNSWPTPLAPVHTASHNIRLNTKFALNPQGHTTNVINGFNHLQPDESGQRSPSIY